MIDFLKRQQRFALIMNRPGGFTLIELLIVIVIIGILAVLIVPNLTLGPQRARDAQRKSDLRNVKTALETYFNDNNSYPSSSNYGGLGGATCKAGSLAPTYLGQVPVDPKGGTCAAPIYTYAPKTVSGTACSTPGLCTSYAMTAALENTGDKSTGVSGGVLTVLSVN